MQHCPSCTWKDDRPVLVGDETTRSRSISSPIESRRISIAIFWIFFIIGTWALVQDNRFMLIVDITTFLAICLFMFTALVFSFAVLNAMRGRQLNSEMPKLQIIHKGMADPVPAPEQVTPAPVIRKRYHNPVSDFMLNAIFKKKKNKFTQKSFLIAPMHRLRGASFQSGTQYRLRHRSRYG